MHIVKRFMPQPLFVNNSSGFVALVSVLIVTVIGAAIVVSLILLGIGSTRTSFALEQSNQAKALANACAEEALQRLAEDSSYAGELTIELGRGTCRIEEVQGAGNTEREIRVNGKVASIVKRVYVEVERIKPTLQIRQWQEVADF